MTQPLEELRRQRKLEYNRRYYSKHKVKLLAYTKAWCAANIDIVRDRKLRRNFGITYADYKKMLASQNGLCAVGPHPLVGRTPTDLHPVDHDHHTGQVRGIVCHHCNLAIGHLRDSSERARQVAEYLDKFSRSEETKCA